MLTIIGTGVLKSDVMMMSEVTRQHLRGVIFIGAYLRKYSFEWVDTSHVNRRGSVLD